MDWLVRHFFFIKVGAKTKQCWASPIFTPLPLRRLWPEHLSRQPTPLAVHTSHSPVRRNIFLRSTFGTACVTLWTTFNRASTFTCLAILSMTPLAPHASHPFLQGQPSSVKKNLPKIRNFCSKSTHSLRRLWTRRLCVRLMMPLPRQMDQNDTLWKWGGQHYFSKCWWITW